MMTNTETIQLMLGSVTVSFAVLTARRYLRFMVQPLPVSHQPQSQVEDIQTLQKMIHNDFFQQDVTAKIEEFFKRYKPIYGTMPKEVNAFNNALTELFELIQTLPSANETVGKAIALRNTIVFYECSSQVYNLKIMRMVQHVINKVIAKSWKRQGISFAYENSELCLYMQGKFIAPVKKLSDRIYQSVARKHFKKVLNKRVYEIKEQKTIEKAIKCITTMAIKQEEKLCFVY